MTAHLGPWSCRFFVLCVLVVGIVFGTSGEPSLAASPELSPRVFLPLQFREFDAGPIPLSPFGVSDTGDLAIASSPFSAQLVAAAGISVNRMSVVWESLEPSNTTPENYEWAHVDKAIGNLLAQGIQPYVMFFRNPSWAASTDCGPLYNPADLEEVMGALAARYPQVPYWGLYNEADNASFSETGISTGGCFGEDDIDENGKPDYQDYAELMRVSWRAVHAASPNAKLSFANLAFDNFTPESFPPNYPGGCCFNYHFLDNLLGYMEANPLPPGQQYGDVLGFNNYLYYDIYYWEKQFPRIGVGAKARAIRDIMTGRGFAYPLVITEMSARSTVPPPNGVSRERQARYLVQMYAQLVYYKIDLGIWWTWEDTRDGACPNCYLIKFGLLDVYLTPKPSYFAYLNLTKQLLNFEPTDAIVKKNYVNLGFKRGDVNKRVIYVKSDLYADDPPSRVVSFNAARVRVTDMFGASRFYNDDGTGKVKVTVGPNPLYVEINP